MTCAPLSTPCTQPPSQELGASQASSLDHHPEMAVMEKVSVRRTLWSRIWKIGVIIAVPLVLSPLLTTVNTTVSDWSLNDSGN